MCWADAPRSRNPRRPVRSTPTSIYLLGLKVWACCILHSRDGGVEIGWSGGGFQKPIPKAPCRLMLTCPSASAGATGAEMQFPADDRRSWSLWPLAAHQYRPGWSSRGVGGGIVIEPHTPAIYHSEEQVWFGCLPSDPNGRKWHTPGEVPTCAAAHRYFSNLP